MFTITKLRRDSHFSYRPGTCGTESTFDIVFEGTGDVVASLFYWEQAQETEADAQALVDALDRLYKRGGFLSIDALDHLNCVLINRYHDSDDEGEAPASERAKTATHVQE